MKKHIFGLALFSIIVGSFVFLWALFGYFTQPIPVVPKVESERLPVFKSENRPSCNMKKQLVNYEVISSQYLKDEEKLVSQLKIRWNGKGETPDKIFIETVVRSTEDFGTPRFEDTRIIYQPLENRKEAVIFVESKINDLGENGDNQNFYAYYNISTDGVDNYFNTKANSIIFVHGRDSIIRR